MEVMAPEKTVVTNTPEPFQITVLANGIIEAKFFGVQTEQTIQALLNALQPIFDDMQKRGQTINMLADNAGVARTTTGANQRVLKAYKEMPIHKAAGFNANPVLRFILNAIIKTAGLTGKVKLFHDREAAERWLLES